MINPFYYYCVSTSLVLIVYLLGWSNDYNSVSKEYVYVLTLIFFSNLIFGFLVNKYCKYRFIIRKQSSVGFYIVVILFVLDTLYAGTFPLLSIITGNTEHYKKLNHIPTLYPIFVALNVFFTIFYYNHYQNSKNKKKLIQVIILLLIIILGMGRGVFFVIILSLGILAISRFTLRKEGIKIKKIVFSSVILITIFTILGNIRPITEDRFKDFSPVEVFLKLGNAREDVKKNTLKKNLFPLYMYIVSPAGNFNYLLSNLKKESKDFSGFIVTNFIPESFHKYFNKEIQLETRYLVNPYFNVSTSYARPFLQFKYWGIFFYQIMIFLFFLLGLSIVSKTNFRAIYLGLFSSMLILSNFSNMFIFDAFIIPVFLTILLSIPVSFKISKI